MLTDSSINLPCPSAELMTVGRAGKQDKTGSFSTEKPEVRPFGGVPPNKAPLESSLQELNT